VKALVLKEYKKLVYEEVHQPQPGPDDLLIQVQACAICGSDVHGLDGSTGRRIPPLIMGHEASGLVAGVGTQVRRFSVGQRVTFDSTIYCGHCFYCRQGQINLCTKRRVLGVSCADYRQNGAFAEYVVIPEHIAYPLPDGLSFEAAAMVEPVAIAYHALQRAAVKLNDNAVVFGAGMIGLFVIQLLKIAGCGKIVAIDLDPDKLALAKKLGATHTFTANQGDYLPAIHGLTNGRGADLAFEVVGTGQVLKSAIDALRQGGTAVLVGNLSSSADLPLQQVVTREIRLLGSCASAGEYPTCLDLIQRQAVKVEPLISAVAPLAEGAAWFERLYAGERGLMKVILKPNRVENKREGDQDHGS
jgi:L-iditol 2-dehydrogenase